MKEDLKTMNCKEARQILWPADGLRLRDAEVERALGHAENCPACNEFLEEDRRVAQVIRATVPKVSAPRELRERLYTALARERAGAARRHERSRRRVVAVALGAVLAASLVIGAIGQWMIESLVPSTAATEFAEDYLRRVVEQDELRSDDRELVAAFFARELGIMVMPPEVPQFRVQRAAICLMNGRRGGVVEYRSNGRHVTYYLIPLDGKGKAREPGIDIREIEGSSAAPAALAHERGLGVATWWDRYHQHALVGNLSADELRSLAPLFTAPISSL